MNKSGYLTTIALIVLGIGNQSLMASDGLHKKDKAVGKKSMEVMAAIDSVIVNMEEVNSRNLLSLIKPMNNAEIGILLENEIGYPERAVDNKVEGTVIVQFTVEPDGSVSHIKTVEGDSEVLTDAVINAVKQMRFQPIIQNGFPARYFLMLPVKFDLL